MTTLLNDLETLDKTLRHRVDVRRRRHGPGDARRAPELTAVACHGAALQVASRHGESVRRHAPRPRRPPRRARRRGCAARRSSARRRGYLVALTVVTVSWGLPVARDQLFIWLVAGIAAFSVPAWRSWGRHAARVAALLRPAGRLRLPARRGLGDRRPALTSSRRSTSTRRSSRGHVPTVWLQQHLWDAGHLHWYDYAVWAVYMTHFFAVWVTAAILWRVARARFRRYAVTAVLLTPRGLRDLLGLSGPASVAGGRGRAHAAGRPRSCPPCGATSASRPRSRSTRTATSSTRSPPCRRCTRPSR